MKDTRAQKTHDQETPQEERGKEQKYICDVCGFIYDPKEGDPDSGIAPGTAFEDIPDDWECPECGVRKSDFTPLDDA